MKRKKGLAYIRIQMSECDTSPKWSFTIFSMSFTKQFLKWASKIWRFGGSNLMSWHIYLLANNHCLEFAHRESPWVWAPEYEIQNPTDIEDLYKIRNEIFRPILKFFKHFLFFLSRSGEGRIVILTRYLQLPCTPQIFVHTYKQILYIMTYLENF